jgi:hypothetical protein
MRNVRDAGLGRREMSVERMVERKRKESGAG